MTNIIIIGKSGSGKTSIANYISENFRYDLVKQVTTRPKRSDDEDKYYNFISVEEFNNLIKDCKLAEWNEFRGWKYGTLKEDLSSSNKILVTNPIGLKQLVWQDLDYIAFYIDVDTGIRVLRQTKRGDDPKEIERRLLTDEKDFRDIDKYVDFTVNNETSLEECVDEILYDIMYFENPVTIEEFYSKLDNCLEKVNKESE